MLKTITFCEVTWMKRDSLFSKGFGPNSIIKTNKNKITENINETLYNTLLKSSIDLINIVWTRQWKSKE